MKRFVTILCTGLLLSGCAVTMPASETIMFEGENRGLSKSDHLIQNNDHKNNDGTLAPHQKRSSVFSNISFPFQKAFLSFSVRPKLQGELGYAKEKFAGFIVEKIQEPDIEDEDFEIAAPLNLAFAVPLPIKRSQDFAVSGNIGLPVLGLDMTYRAFENTYFTANISYLSGELIAQRRLLLNENIGIALGTQYRLQRRWLRVLEGPDEIFGLSTIISLVKPARVFYNHTFGLRSVIYLPVSENTYLHVVAAPGYDANLNEFTFNMGLSLKYQLW